MSTSSGGVQVQREGKGKEFHGEKRTSAREVALRSIGLGMASMESYSFVQVFFLLRLPCKRDMPLTDDVSLLRMAKENYSAQTGARHSDLPIFLTDNDPKARKTVKTAISTSL